MTRHVLNWDEAPPEECRHGAVAVGNFDGVHRGHLALLAELRARARSVAGPAVVLTFDPHPLQLLRPELFQPVLTARDARAKLLQEHGADHVVILRTTHELLQLEAEEFFQRVVVKQLAARALVEGVNFGFGKNRAGTIETLRALCRPARLELTVVPPLTTADGRPVSSSRVRAALEAGDVGLAADLLKRPFRIEGRVAAGQRRGQLLGFPTANLEGIGTLLPRDGVYAVRAGTGGSCWPGAANIGPNPTFGEHARKIEVHLIGFQGDLYGQALDVDFVARLREVRTFASPTELVEQLHADVKDALAQIGRQGGSTG